ncbi:hypothetical protein [Oceanobacillus kapialis]|uniref:Sporulation histidine kinase inhibitor Sda n=1 Tax=Oceanobacillus kapialis TaxID=481353 RepID=A0ABW5Q0T1_9BACI
MLEQEKFKTMLKKVIQDTENQNIQSSQEMIQALINELTHQRLMPNVPQTGIKK